MPKKALITGAAGFIGSQLAKHLISLGHEVVIIDNLTTGYLENIPKQSRFIHADCFAQEAITQLNNEHFDIIFHIAGQSSGEISFENPVYDINSNTVSTLRLLDYARKTGCSRFVYASTMSVYGENGKEECSELDKLSPKSFYAIGKKASEDYLKVYSTNYGINFTALRYFNVYGPGQNMANMKQGMVSIFLKQIIDPAYSEVLVKGDKNRFRDFIFIDDVVEITAKSGLDNIFSNDIVNVGTGVKTTVEELINIMKETTLIDKPVIYKGKTPGDQFGIYANNHKLLSGMGIKLTSLEIGMQKFVKSVS